MTERVLSPRVPVPILPTYPFMGTEDNSKLSGPSQTSPRDPSAIQHVTSSETPAAAASNDAKPKPSNPDGVAEEDDFHPGPRLWIIIIGLGITLLLTALENTVVTVAMPAIVSDLGLGENYIWVTNAFFMCR